MTSGTNDCLYQWDVEYCKKLKELGFDVTWTAYEGLYHCWHSYQRALEDGFKWLPLDRFDESVCCIGPNASVERIFVGWKPYYNA